MQTSTTVQPEEDAFLTIKEAAALVRVADSTLNRAIRNNPSVRIREVGRVIRIHKADFLKWAFGYAPPPAVTAPAKTASKPETSPKADDLFSLAAANQTRPPSYEEIVEIWNKGGKTRAQIGAEVGVSENQVGSALRALRKTGHTVRPGRLDKRRPSNVCPAVACPAIAPEPPQSVAWDVELAVTGG